MKRIYSILNVLLIALLSLNLYAQQPQESGGEQPGANQEMLDILGRYGSSDALNRAKQSVENNLLPDQTCDMPGQPVVEPEAHKFTINADGKQVIFSKGNLRYNYASDSWSFAPRQYDIVGKDNINLGNPSYNGYIDLFAWSSDGQFGVNPSNADKDYRGAFVDWGSKIGGGWRTLTLDEWKYLLKERKVNGAAAWAMARINATVGMIVLPDDWRLPEGLSLVQGYHVTQNGILEKNIYTSAQWYMLEQAGAVFLPAAGSRTGGYGNKMNGSSPASFVNEETGWYSWVDNIYNYGYYWTSSEDTRNGGIDFSYYLIFSSEIYAGAESGTFWSREKRRGNSVRLVYDENYIVPPTQTYTLVCKTNLSDDGLKSYADLSSATLNVYLQALQSQTASPALPDGGVVPVPQAPAGSVYVFNGWQITYDNTLVTATAVFELEKLEYTITFKGPDGSVYCEGKYTVGAFPNCTIKTEDIPGYRFDRWEPEIHAVNGDQVYTAVLVKSLTYNFYDEKGEKLLATVVDVDDDADPAGVFETSGAQLPTKEADDKVWEFEKWVEFESGQNNVRNFKAQFKEIETRKYTVYFMGEDCKEELGSTMVDYGSTIDKFCKSCVPNPKDKEGYTFLGWKLKDSEDTWFDWNTKVVSDMTFCAVYSDVVTVKFKWNDEILGTTTHTVKGLDSYKKSLADIKSNMLDGEKLFAYPVSEDEDRVFVLNGVTVGEVVNAVLDVNLSFDSRHLISISFENTSWDKAYCYVFEYKDKDDPQPYVAWEYSYGWPGLLLGEEKTRYTFDIPQGYTVIFNNGHISDEGTDVWFQSSDQTPDAGDCFRWDNDKTGNQYNSVGDVVDCDEQPVKEYVFMVDGKKFGIKELDDEQLNTLLASGAVNPFADDPSDVSDIKKPADDSYGYIFTKWALEAQYTVVAQFKQIPLGAFKFGTDAEGNDVYRYFAPGNLQYSQSGGRYAANGEYLAGTFRFARHQYDIVSYSDNSQIGSATNIKWIDNLAWGTSGYQNANPHEVNSSCGNCGPYPDGDALTGAYSFYDWGLFNSIDGYEAGEWRTMTKGEADTLLNQRTDYCGYGLYAHAVVEGVYGNILFPDYFEMPEGISFTKSPSDYKTNTYNAGQWAELENAGAVFVPLGYFRDENGTAYNQINKRGDYWTSTGSGNASAYVMTTYPKIMTLGRQPKACGVSIRLISAGTERPQSAGQGRYPEMTIKFSADWDKVYVSVFNLEKEDFERESLEKDENTGWYTAVIQQGAAFYFHNEDESEKTHTQVGLMSDKCFVLDSKSGNVYRLKEVEDCQLAYYFSVSDNLQVRFSTGNLVKKNDGSYSFSKTLSYAEDQFFNYNNKTLNATSGTPTFGPLDSETDWGASQIGDEPAGTYRTLTYAEWNYVASREGKAMLATVVYESGDKIKGLLLLPDNWKTPSALGRELSAGIAEYETNILSYDEWTLIEKSGAVFMPAAGRKSGVLEVKPFEDQISCLYWCSDIMTNSKGDEVPSQFYVYANTVTRTDLTESDAFWSRCPVRLVADRNVVAPPVVDEKVILTFNDLTKDYEVEMTSEDGNTYTCTVEGVYLSYGNNYYFALVDNGEAQGNADMSVEVAYEGRYSVVFTYDRVTHQVTASPEVEQYYVAFEVGGEVSTDCHKYMSSDEIHDFIEAGKAPDCMTIDVPQGSKLVWTNDQTITSGQYTLTLLQYVPAGGFAIGVDKDEKTGRDIIRYAKFSKGNLQYSSGAGKYDFAVHQYDFIGAQDNEGYYHTHNVDETIDLFAWSIARDMYGNPVGSDPAGAWRAMTAEEWTYLLHKRENAENLYGFATITDDSGKDIHGLVLLPGDWEKTSELYGLEFTPFGDVYKISQSEGVQCTVPDGYGYESNKYSAYQWGYMEMAGAIFLPVAGYMKDSPHGEYNYATFWEGVGYYWSSTTATYQGLSLQFRSTYYYPDYDAKSSSMRNSIRPIQDLETTISQPAAANVFKTSDDTYVEFTKGNLVQSGNSYSFAATQFESGSYLEWNGSDFGSALTVETDWGANPVNGEAAGTYRTLSFDEWDFLLSRDEKGMQATVMAQSVPDQVNGSVDRNVKGFILLPENWEEPEDLGVELTYDNQSSFDDNQLNIRQWYLMEQAGAIFLPAAGRITDGSADNVLYNNQYACYWSSSNYAYKPSAAAPYTMYAPAPVSVKAGGFGQLELTAGDNGVKMTVRLVKDYSPEAHQGYTVSGENAWFGDDVVLAKNSIGVYTAAVSNLNLTAGDYSFTLSDNGVPVQSSSLKIEYDGVYNIEFGYYNEKLMSKVHPVAYNVAFEIGGVLVENYVQQMSKDEINALINEGFVPDGLDLDVPASATLVWDQDKSVKTGRYTLNGTLKFEDNDTEYYFTVNNEGKRVQFAKGNLATRFSFTKNQYDFGAYFKWNGETLATPLTDETDWGAMQINGENSGTYRTPSQQEWIYLTATRENRSLWAAINVNADKPVEGYILLPDNWTEPQDLGVELNLNSKSKNTLTLFQWLNMENAGAVFLPAARKKVGSDFAFDDKACCYWSSSTNGSNPYNVDVRLLNSSGANDNGEYVSMPVRLVKDYDENASSQPAQPEEKIWYFAINSTGGNSDYVQFSSGNLLSDYTFVSEQYEAGDYLQLPDQATQALDFISEWLTDKEINDEPAGTYRLLTNAEWKHLFGRDGEDVPNLCMQARIMVNADVNVSGFIILPDNWVEPENLGYVLSYNNNSYFTDNEISLSQWKMMEEAGAIFMPAAGRKENFLQDKVSDYNSEGYYWSSSYKQSGNIYVQNPVMFDAGSYNDFDIPVAQRGFVAMSVRLVKAHNANFSKPQKDYYFAVSDDKYVQFSKTNAYDNYIGYQYSDGGYYVWPKSIDEEASLCADWSACKLGDGYRLLTAAEWEYLLGRNAKGMQCGIILSETLTKNGFLLLPEEWEEPEGLSLNLTYSSSSQFSDNVLSYADWAKIEKAGAVFLPASGTKNTAGTEFLPNEICSYWTSSVEMPTEVFPHNTAAVYAEIWNDIISVTNTGVNQNNQIGRSLRFVKDYQSGSSVTTPDKTIGIVGSWAGETESFQLTEDNNYKYSLSALELNAGEYSYTFTNSGTEKQYSLSVPYNGVYDVAFSYNESSDVVDAGAELKKVYVDFKVNGEIADCETQLMTTDELAGFKESNGIPCDGVEVSKAADSEYGYVHTGWQEESGSQASPVRRKAPAKGGSGNMVLVPMFKPIPLGAFTLGYDADGKEIYHYFAPGNLQYSNTGTHLCADGEKRAGKFRFAQNQYDFVGKGETGNVQGSDNSNKGKEGYEGWTDLFGWGTSGYGDGTWTTDPFITTETYDYYGPYSAGNTASLTGDYANYDWGVFNAIGGYEAGTWRAMTNDELGVLVETRTDYSGLGLQVRATVNDVQGVILIPDYFEVPDGLTIKKTSSSSGYNTNPFTADEWKAIEANGAVFLPQNCSLTGGTANDVKPGNTYYWTSTRSAKKTAYSLKLGAASKTNNINTHYCVRLVSVGSTRPVASDEPGGDDPQPSYKGAFSVDDGVLVKFAPGNLLYNAKSDKWQFADEQSTIIGKDNENRSDSYDGWIDLFAWGTSGEGDMNPWDLGDKNNASDFGYSGGIADTDYDWGIKNAIGSYKAGTWHTPSSDNWNYVFKERDKADDLWFFAKIGTVTGIILLPDEFENTYKVSFTAGDKNDISSDDWTKLESEGAVLLPVCGSASMNGTKINVVNYIGENAEMLYYWSTTDKADDDTRAYQLRANYTNTKLTGTAYYDYKSRACAVRLIKPFDPYSDAPDPYEPGGDEPQQTGKAFKVGEDANGEAVLVYIAPGNLQYNAKSDKWRFATNQYDFVGDDNFGNVYEGDTKCDNLKTASDYDGWIDMFGYGTSGFNEKYPWLRSNSRGSYHNEDIAGTSYDWGVNNQIGDDKKGVWRTMTKEEWDGLIQYNTYALATVNDVRGVIFLPPSFSYPAGFEKELQAGYIGNYTKHTYTAEEWAALEQEGAVFLPAGGSLNPNSSALSDLSDTKAHSYYWASTVYTGNNDRNAYAFHATTNTSATKGYERYMGYNVRLVKDVNAQPVTVYTLVSDKTIGANKEWEMTKVDDNTYTLSLTDVRLYRNESFSLYAAADGQSLQQENTTFDVDYEGDYNLTFTYVVNSAGVTVEKEIVKYLQVHFCDRDGNILCDNRSYERTPAEIDNLGDYNPCDADLDYDDEYINYVHSGWTHGESVVAGSYSLYPVYTKQPKNETAEIKFWTDWAEVYANDYDPEKDATVREKLSKSPDGWYRYNVDVWHNISFDNNKGLSTRSADEILQPYCFVLGDLSVGEGDTHALYDLVEDCDWSDTDMKNTTKTVTVRLFTNWKNVYAHAYLKGYTLQPFGDDIGGGKTALRLVADGENGMFDYAWYSFELPYVEDSYIHPAYMVDFYGSNGKDVKTDSTGVRVNTDRCFMTTESNGVWSKSGIKCGIGLQLKISGVDQLIAFDPAKTNSFKDVTLSAGTHEFILRYGTIQIVPYKASIDIATAGMYNIDVTWAYDEGRIDVETESLQAFQTGDNEFVRFADGNLQYKPSEAQWRLCETPWRSNDVYNFEDNISASYPHWLDIFGWVTSGWNSGAAAYQPYSLSENDADYLLIDRDHDGTYNYSLPYFAPNADWCVYNTIGDDQPSTWSTMDQGDWIYLLNLRKDAAKLAGLAYAYGHSGLIILPDGWVCPDGLTFNSFSDKGWTFNSQIWGYSGDDNGFSNHNSYFNKEWDKMVASGAVFIPAYTASIADYEHGYWTTSQSGKTTAVALQISETSVRLKELPKHTRLSVRPVKKNAVLPALETGYSIRQDINYVETLFEKDDEYNVYKANQLDVTVQHGTYTFTVYYNGTKHSETEVTIDLDGRYDFRYKLNPDGTGLQIDVNNDWYNNVSFNVDGKYIYSMDEIKQSRIDEILANGAYNPWMLSISRPDDSEYSYTFHSWEVDTEAETKGHKGLKAYFFPHQHPNLVRFKSDWSEVYVEEKDKSDGTLKTTKLSLANSGWYAYQYTEGNSVRFHNGFDGKGLSTRFIEVAESPRFLLDDISVKTGESRAFYDVKIGKLEDETKKTVTVRLFSDWNDVYAHAYVGSNTLQCFGDAISDGVMGLKLSTTESDETVFGYKWYAFEMPYKTGQNAYSVDFFGKKVNNVSTASDAVTVTKDMCFETNSVSGSWQKITIDCNTKMQVSVVSVNGTTKYDLDAENKCSVIEKPLSEETASVKLLYGGKQLADFSKDLSITANGVYNLDIAVLPDKSEIQVEVKKLKTFKIGTSIVGSTEYDLLVFFAPGNLQYNAKEDKWRFSKDESDHIAGGNRYLSSDYNGWVDLFGWGTSGWTNGKKEYQPYLVSETCYDFPYLQVPVGEMYSPLFSNFDYNGDWAYQNQIDDYAPGTWQTMHSGNWKYVLGMRPDADQHVGYGKVKDHSGLILLPDDWELPSGCSWHPITYVGGTWNAGGFYDISSSTPYNYNSYNVESWAKMSEAGAVFLPLTGALTHTADGPEFEIWGDGYYWTSEQQSQCSAYCMRFSNERLYGGMTLDKNTGASVRPVRVFKVKKVE